jgi:hypothetical protein
VRIVYHKEIGCNHSGGFHAVAVVVLVLVLADLIIVWLLYGARGKSVSCFREPP